MSRKHRGAIEVDDGERARLSGAYWTYILQAVLNHRERELQKPVGNCGGRCACLEKHSQPGACQPRLAFQLQITLYNIATQLFWCAGSLAIRTVY